MGDELVEVRPDALRGCAAELAGTGHHVGRGLADVPSPLAPLDDPTWVAAQALATLESAVHGWFGRLGGRVVQTADALRTAADEYDAVDDRAAQRFTGNR